MFGDAQGCSRMFDDDAEPNINDVQGWSRRCSRTGNGVAGRSRMPKDFLLMFDVRLCLYIYRYR